MNPFTAHPKHQGVTYLEHWRFAMGIACRLLASVAAFALHAALPSVPIARRLDLESTAAYLAECNRWIETTKQTAHAGSELDLVARYRQPAHRRLLVTQP